MADKSLISELLKTPSQIRKEEQEALRQKGLERAALMQTGGAGKSLFGGMFQNFAAQQAAEVDKRTQQVVQGLGQAAGMDMRSPAERQAAAQQKVLAGTQMGNLQSMKTRRQMLVDSGADPRAIMMFDEAIAQAEQQAKANMQADRRIAVSEGQLEIARSEEARADVNQEMLNDVRQTLGDIDLNKPEDRAKAATELFSIGKIDDAMQLLELNKPEEFGDTTTAKNIKFYAKLLKCDLKDPECAEAARTAMVEDKRTTPNDQILVKRYDKIEESRDNAAKAKSNYTVMRESLNRIEQGDINVGTFGTGRQAMERLLQETLGLDRDGSVERTTAVLMNLKKLSGDYLGTGVYGAGTGLSDADRKRAEELFGASGTLTPDEIKEVLDLHMRYERDKIIRHNNRVKDEKRFTDDFFAKAGISRESLLAEVPPPYIAPEWKTYNNGAYYKNPYTGLVYDSTTGEKWEPEKEENE